MSKLDELTEKFSETKDSNVFTEFMETLEKSVIMMPVALSDEMAARVKAAAKNGKPLPMPKGSKPNIRILPLKNGKFAVPVFTSIGQVPKDKETPLIQVPFKVAVDLAKAPGSNATTIIVNPFSKGVILKEELVDVAYKRLQAMAEGRAPGQAKGQDGNQPKTIQLTEKQVHTLMHSKLAREYLPGRFFKDMDEAFSDLRVKKEKMLIDGYKSMYPSGLECPYEEEDVSIMNLQIDENLLITRIDLPELNNKLAGSPQRVYLAKTGDGLRYFIIERPGKETPGNIVEMKADGNAETVMEAPDNGVEIETIMSIVRPS